MCKVEKCWAGLVLVQWLTVDVEICQFWHQISFHITFIHARSGRLKNSICSYQHNLVFRAKKVSQQLCCCYRGVSLQLILSGQGYEGVLKY